MTKDPMAEALVDECTQDLNRAVWTLVRRRTDWATLPEAEREKLKADMDRVDRQVLMASVERVIGSVAMFARIEVAKSKEASR